LPNKRLPPHASPQFSIFILPQFADIGDMDFPTLDGEQAKIGEFVQDA
jgi:hypothetical protein